MDPYAPVGLLLLFFEKIGKTPLYCTDQSVPMAICQPRPESHMNKVGHLSFSFMGWMSAFSSNAMVASKW
jgi:hypothetical protein